MSKEDESFINIIYNINEEDRKYRKIINIFGTEFVENNIDKYIIILDSIEYEIAEQCDIENYFYNKLKIKLKGINNITDLSHIFRECKSLTSLPNISNWNTNNVINMSDMFYGCLSLSSLPDISKWNTNNITNMHWMFRECSSLSSLPDISKWNINNIKDMRYMFYGCSSLSSLPDISEWNTSKC